MNFIVLDLYVNEILACTLVLGFFSLNIVSVSINVMYISGSFFVIIE